MFYGVDFFGECLIVFDDIFVGLSDVVEVIEYLFECLFGVILIWEGNIE